MNKLTPIQSSIVSLRINEPVRTERATKLKQPIFTPPPSPSEVAVASSASPQVNKLSEDLNGTGDIYSSQDKNISPDAEVTQEAKGTPDEKQPEDANSTEVNFSPEDENLPQGENVTYPSEPRLSPEERVKLQIEKLRGGYTRVPNSILMDLIHGKLSKAEIKIVLLIARLTISFNERKTAHLSKVDFERLAGLQGKSVLEAIPALEQKGIIFKIKGNQYNKNRLGLCYDKNLFNKPDPIGPKDDSAKISTEGEDCPSVTSGSEVKKDFGVQKGPQDQKITEGQGEKSTYPPDQKGTEGEVKKSTHYKQDLSNEVSNNFTNYSLSTDFECQRFFENYFSGIGLKNKRESERGKFRSLGESGYRPQQIANSLQYLQRFGLPKTGEPCHSPMGFLAVAIREVLGLAEEGLLKAEKEADQQRREDQEKKTAEEKARREAEAFNEKVAAFKAVFPTEELQAEYFEKFARRYPALNRNGPILQNMAISGWSSEFQLGQATEISERRGIA